MKQNSQTEVKELTVSGKVLHVLHKLVHFPPRGKVYFLYTLKYTARDGGDDKEVVRWFDDIFVHEQHAVALDIGGLHPGKLQ